MENVATRVGEVWNEEREDWDQKGRVGARRQRFGTRSGRIGTRRGNGTRSSRAPLVVCPVLAVWDCIECINSIILCCVRA